MSKYMKNNKEELTDMRINVSLSVNDERDRVIIKHLKKYGSKTYNAEFCRTCMYLKILNEISDNSNLADLIASKVIDSLKETIPTSNNNADTKKVNKTKLRTFEEDEEEEFVLEYTDEDDYYYDDDDDDMFI